jgi:N-acetyl-anhydromuramyl-L-alanine amidase AmpD
MMPNEPTPRKRRPVPGLTLLLGAGCLILSGLVLFFARRSAPVVSVPLAYRYIPSPNVDDRPPDVEVTCVVLHATVVDTLEGTVRAFLDPARKISAHYVVDKQGRVVQMVPVEKRAWHAGESVLEGVPRVNDYSVGIEIVNRNDGRDPYPDAQIEAVAGIVRLLRAHYPIPDSRIVSHAQVAMPPDRKSDPLNLDFRRVLDLAR